MGRVSRRSGPRDYHPIITEPFGGQRIIFEVEEVEGAGQFVDLEIVTEDPSRAESLTVGSFISHIHCRERIDGNHPEVHREPDQ